jgi:hypothetical protein
MRNHAMFSFAINAVYLEVFGIAVIEVTVQDGERAVMR